jgi:hypothetical protein
MRASKPLKVLYKLTEECLALSNKLNMPIGLESKELFDYSYYVRAITDSPITINPKELKPVNTGLHIIVTDPYYEVVIGSYIDLLKSKELAIFPCNYYKYGNEIVVLLYNYSNKVQSINPCEKIGLLSFKEITMVEASNIDIIYKDSEYILETLTKKSDYLCKSKDHTWVQKEKINTKIILSPELQNEVNSTRVIKNSCYLCIEENENLKSSIVVTKGSIVTIKKIKKKEWRKVITNEGQTGWILVTNLEIIDPKISQGDTINSTIEKRLR